MLTLSVLSSVAAVAVSWLEADCSGVLIYTDFDSSQMRKITLSSVLAFIYLLAQIAASCTTTMRWSSTGLVNL